MIEPREGESEKEYLRRLFAFIDHTPAGPQHVLEGCARVPDKNLAERRWSAPKRSRAPQREAGPLFSDDAAQLDIIDTIRRAAK